MSPLPVITVNFFREFAVGEPAGASEEWERWQRKHPNATERAKYRKLLEIAVERAEATIRCYLDGRSHKLSLELLDRLDRVARGLNQDPPHRSFRRTRPARRANRVALLTELAVPSESYHFELIGCVIREAFLHHLSLSVHEAPGEGLAVPVERILANFRPDGVIMIRLTPSRRVVELLAGARIPTVLIHGDRHRYEAPVLANVVPQQEKIETDLNAWLEDQQQGEDKRSASKRAKRRRVVVVTMREEQTHVSALQNHS